MARKRTRIKFCGMTRKEDLDYAISLGVDAIGFILFNKSHRYVTVPKVKQLINDIPPFVDLVAVVVNPSQGEIQNILDELPIQYLQFHGNESLDFCEQFNFPFIKSIPASTRERVEHSLKQYPSSTAILLDTPSTHFHGGTGKTFNWSIIPQHLEHSFILAGGLDENNIVNALELIQPFAVDVCSGIELSHGLKDKTKMSTFVNTVRNYDEQ